MLVPASYNLMGVADPSGTLDVDEVCVVVQSKCIGLAMGVENEVRFETFQLVCILR